MLGNYLKIAIRNLVKNRFFTLLNIAGLAIGISVSVILFLYVLDELSFDKYHSKAEDIYRLGITVEFDNSGDMWAQVPNIAGPLFKEKISTITEQVRLLRHNFGRTGFFTVHDKNFAEEDLYWADSTLFRVFDVPLIHGNPETALSDPNSIIISRSTSEKIFGNEVPLGTVMTLDNVLDVKITGVFEDFPLNSTLDCHMIGSFHSQKWASERLVWGNSSFETYIVANPSTSKEELEIAMNQVLDESLEEDNQWFSFWIQPLVDIHLHSGGIANKGYSKRLSDISVVRFLSVLALAILLLACFNYINMTTARSQERFREVGISKTLGATRSQMIHRFFLETGILVLIAILLSLLLAELSLPYFEALTGRSLDVLSIFSGKWWLLIMGLWAGISIIAGFYPAVFLSSFSPNRLLNPFQKDSSVNHFLRKILVVGQFSVCIGLIIGIMIFNRQLAFISTKKLGFQPEQVIAINTAAAEEVSQINGLMNSYRNMPEVKALCRAQGFPGLDVSGYSMTKPLNDEVTTLVYSNHVTSGIDDVLELNYLTGKPLPEKSAEDTTVQVVMNLNGVEFLGWTPEEAIGKSPPGLFNYPATIVGVIEDFHHKSMHSRIAPYVFHNGKNLGGMPYILVKFNTSDINKNLNQLESAFNEHLPKSAFTFTFLDEYTDRLYQSERRLSKIVMSFTMIAIFISCLGLFGLAAYTAERRTKEIGIRKVLGATTIGIIALLSKDFLKLVIIALLIASPLSYFVMNRWLEEFAYRIDIPAWIFALAGVVSVVIAFLTMSFQSLKAALTDPANCLRNE